MFSSYRSQPICQSTNAACAGSDMAASPSAVFDTLLVLKVSSAPAVEQEANTLEQVRTGRVVVERST